MTRITSRQAFEGGIEQLQQRQRALAHAQQQLTSGKRVERASDDPAAAARAERALAAIGRSAADTRALEASRNILTQTESVLGDAGDVLQQAREALVAAGNASYGDSERGALADQIAALRTQLFSLANRTDGSGAHLFGGQGSAEPPFVDEAGGVAWRATAGERVAALDEALPLSTDGRAAWLGARTGNGLFETRPVMAAPAQAQAWIDAGRVVDPAAFFAASSPPAVADPAALDWRIEFAGAPGAVTYSVLKDGAATALANVPYTSGQAIAFDGLSVAVNGSPQAGDAFELRPSTATQSVFDTLDRVVAELRTPQRSSSAVAQGVQRALTEIDSSSDALSALRSRVGQVLQRADAVEGRLEDQTLAAQTEKSNAEDLDMVAAIAEFQTQSTGYDAALKAYASVQRLSLFDYVKT
jgi:flagellar hook-associated protein 3 FlgL